MLKQFEKIFTKFNKNLEQETKRAIQDAQRKTVTEWGRRLHADSGLKKQADAKARIRKFAPQYSNGRLISALIGLAVGFGFALRKFKFTTKVVKTRIGKRKSVLSDRFRKGKVLAPGVFVMEKNGNKFLAKRKGKEAYPTTEPKSPAEEVLSWGEKVRPELNRFYMGLFKENLTKRIQRFINK